MINWLKKLKRRKEKREISWSLSEALKVCSRENVWICPTMQFYDIEIIAFDPARQKFKTNTYNKDEGLKGNWKDLSIDLTHLRKEPWTYFSTKNLTKIPFWERKWDEHVRIIQDYYNGEFQKYLNANKPKR